MPERLYPGEPFERARIRADLAAADRERAEADARAEAERITAAHAAARARVREPPPVAESPAVPAPTEPPKRRTWRDLSPDELNRF